jgi:hypothetical protein
MKIAFMSSKGAASKTTFAKFVAEYFNGLLSPDVNNYSEEELKFIEKLNPTKKIFIFSVTNDEYASTHFEQSFATITTSTTIGSD